MVRREDGKETRGRLLDAALEVFTDEKVLFCEMSISNQCRALSTISRSDFRYLLGQPLSPDLIRRWADHITRFSLAGIRATSKPLEA